MNRPACLREKCLLSLVCVYLCSFSLSRSVLLCTHVDEVGSHLKFTHIDSFCRFAHRIQPHAFTSLGSMSKRLKVNDVAVDSQSRKRQAISALVPQASRSSLIRTLQTLQEHGMLHEDLQASSSSHGRSIDSSRHNLAFNTGTPYGQLVREMPLMNDDSLWYLDPFALLSHVCTVSPMFFGMLRSIVDVAAGTPLRLILYLDGINPGNPLAPDPQKLLQAVYWSFLDFPGWLLSRKDGWMCFTLAREKHLLELPGQITEFCTKLLSVFFNASTSFDKGFIVTSSSSAAGESFVLKASFAGFIADEKGLKEIFGIKGQAGSVPCWGCLNIRNRWVQLPSSGNLQYFWDCDLSNRQPRTRKHVDVMVQRLRAAPTNQQRKDLSTTFGVNFVPSGILFSTSTSTIVHPIRSYIRDWMHTYASGGVAGSHISLICGALAAVGISINIIQTYSRQFLLPRSRKGKVSDSYFKAELIDTDHVKHFANDVLGMVTIMHAFLIEKIAPRQMLENNVKCFGKLFKILCILRRGTMDPSIHATLLSIIVEHNRLFLSLYGEEAAKIKFHHTFHIPDDMLYLGKAVSCFPTERKNKDAIAASVACSKNLEKSAVINFLTKSTSIYGEQHWCSEYSLTNERPCHGIFVSKHATFPCGQLSVGDMLALRDGSIAKVLNFFRDETTFAVLAEVHKAMANRVNSFSLESCVLPLDSACIIEAIFWYQRRDSIFAVLPEFA